MIAASASRGNSRLTTRNVNKGLTLLDAMNGGSARHIKFCKGPAGGLCDDYDDR